MTIEGNAALEATVSADIQGLVQSIREFFTKPAKPRWKGDARGEQPPDRFVYLLDHEYTQHGLQWTRLKGVDAQRTAALRAVAAELDCEIFLALADVHETWACEDEDSDYSDYGGKDFVDCDGDDENGAESGDGALGQSPDPNLTEFIERDVESGTGWDWPDVGKRLLLALMMQSSASRGRRQNSNRLSRSTKATWATMATPWNIGTTVRPWSYGRVNEPSSSVQRHRPMGNRRDRQGAQSTGFRVCHQHGPAPCFILVSCRRPDS